MLESGRHKCALTVTVLDHLELYLPWLATAGAVALYLRLRREGLHSVYRVFSFYLLYNALRTVLLLSLPPLAQVLFKEPRVSPLMTNLYGWMWVATEPVVWVFYILIVLEMYSLAFRNYKGIESLSRWAVFAGLGIALLLSALTLPADLSNTAEQYPIIRTCLMVQRGVSSGLVVFLLAITVFLVWFPVPVSRNFIVYTVVYAVYFLSSTLTILMRNVGGIAYAQWRNIASSCVSIACLTVWILFLNRGGEAKTATVRHDWTAQREKQLIEQLAAINSTLDRTRRR
jgi:hypothetical protein